MLSRPTLLRVIILSVLVLIGYSLARAIYWHSTMGIILALISLCAVVYFIFILAKARSEMLAQQSQAETKETN